MTNDRTYEHRYVPNEPAHFTPSERELLWLLWSGQGRTVRHEALWNALYSHKPDCDQADPNMVKVILAKARKKLVCHQIRADRGVGYFLVPNE